MWTFFGAMICYYYTDTIFTAIHVFFKVLKHISLKKNYIHPKDIVITGAVRRLYLKHTDIDRFSFLVSFISLL